MKTSLRQHRDKASGTVLHFVHEVRGSGRTTLACFWDGPDGALVALDLDWLAERRLLDVDPVPLLIRTQERGHFGRHRGA